MRKSFIAALIIAASFSLGIAQENTTTTQDAPSRGVAPKEMNGIGRADVRVFDDAGNPIKNAYIKLESTRTDGFFCESWAYTDGNGIAVLPPLHMGSLKMIVKAKGYKTQKVEVLASNLGDPVRVTMEKK